MIGIRKRFEVRFGYFENYTRNGLWNPSDCLWRAKWIHNSDGFNYSAINEKKMVSILVLINGRLELKLDWNKNQNQNRKGTRPTSIRPWSARQTLPPNANGHRHRTSSSGPPPAALTGKEMHVVCMPIQSQNIIFKMRDEKKELYFN